MEAFRLRYNCMEYKNSPYYRGSILWDKLPLEVRNDDRLSVFNAKFASVYKTYDPEFAWIYYDTPYVIFCVFKIILYFPISCFQGCCYNTHYTCTTLEDQWVFLSCYLSKYKIEMLLVTLLVPYSVLV